MLFAVEGKIKAIIIITIPITITAVNKKVIKYLLTESIGIEILNI